jgi:phage terminase large subunit-like protein
MPRNKEEFESNAAAFKLLADRLKGHVTKPNMYGYTPHAKQEIFHRSTSKKKLYIGGNRSGKTVGGIVEDLWWLTGRHPYREVPEAPVRGRIVSVDFVNGIEKIILPEISRWIPASDLKGGSWSTAYDKLLRVLTLANGSFVEFMSYDQDLDKFAGTSRHFIHFDEEPPQDIYTECLARLVDTGGSFWITMTPVEGMTWIYDTLYEPGLLEENDIQVIEISMTENPYLGEVEVQSFLSSLSADERKAREHGKFVQLGGLVYKDFNKDLHVVEPMVPSKDWQWVASLDHGYNNPTAWLWHGISADGSVVTFYEHYEQGMTVDAHAKRVHEINNQLGRPPDYYIGDPSIRNTDPITGTSIQQEYIKYGIPITLANNDVAAGINRVASYLKPRADGRPNLVITENCDNLIRELGRYRWATYANRRLNNKNNAQEKAHKKDDHACDSLRYFIMSRPDLAAGYFDRNQSNSIRNPLGAPSTAEYRAGSELIANQWSGGEYETQWSYDEEMGSIW